MAGSGRCSSSARTAALAEHEAVILKSGWQVEDQSADVDLAGIIWQVRVDTGNRIVAPLNCVPFLVAIMWLNRGRVALRRPAAVRPSATHAGRASAE